MPHVVPSDVVGYIDRSVRPDITNRVSDSNVSQLLALLELIEEVPRHLLQLDSSNYAALIAATADLQARVDAYRSMSLRDRMSGTDNVLLPSLSAFGDATALKIIRDQLAQCPDEVPTPTTAALKFIVDPVQREAIRIDLSTVASSLANNEWKAATILAGSLIEALLLWAIKQRTTDVPAVISALVKSGVFKGKQAPDPGDPDDWKLFQYIPVARELKEIEPRTAKIADEVRDFRNLIHPGLTVRSGQACTRGTAHSAYGALQLVIEDLTKTHSQ
jgi:hypothetical protein